MNTELTIETERVADVPLLLADEKGLVELLNAYLSPHRNWQRLSISHVVVYLSPHQPRSFLILLEVPKL